MRTRVKACGPSIQCDRAEPERHAQADVALEQTDLRDGQAGCVRHQDGLRPDVNLADRQPIQFSGVGRYAKGSAIQRAPPRILPPCERPSRIDLHLEIHEPAAASHGTMTVPSVPAFVGARQEALGDAHPSGDTRCRAMILPRRTGRAPSFRPEHRPRIPGRLRTAIVSSPCGRGRVDSATPSWRPPAARTSLPGAPAPGYSGPPRRTLLRPGLASSPGGRRGSSAAVRSGESRYASPPASSGLHEALDPDHGPVPGYQRVGVGHVKYGLQRGRALDPNPQVHELLPGEARSTAAGAGRAARLRRGSCA